MSDYRDDADESNPVEEKRKTKKNVTIPKNPDWKGFFSGCLSNLILTMLIALIGANFLYLTSLGSKSLDFLFPSEESVYFLKQVGGKCSFYDRMKNGVLGDKMIFKLGKLGVPPSTGWPYNIKTDDTIDFTGQGFKNWFALSTADVYSLSRGIIKSILEFFSKEKEHMFSYDLVQIILINSILILLVPVLPLLVFFLFLLSFFFGVSRAWNSDDLPPIMGFLFMTIPAFWVACGLSAIMPIQMIFTLLILPLYMNGEAVFDIMKCNGFLFSTIFLILSTISASKSNLDIGFIIGLGISIAMALYRTLKK